MEKFDSSKTLLIILGASAWPQHEDYKNSSYTDGNNPFQRSVKEIEDYFVNTMKLQEKQVMKELFNSEDPVEKQVEKMESFLQNNNPNDDGDLFIYYVGHGQVVIGDKDYFLYIRNSKKGQPRTFFSMTELFDKFKEHARPKRLYIIVDACYSGVVRRFAPEFINGTVLFCASSEGECAKIQKDSNTATTKAEPTLFTDSLLKVLQNATGADHQKKLLSCHDVNSLLRKYLDGQEGVPEHQYYVIGKSQNIIGNLGIFPNPAYVEEKTRSKLLYPMSIAEKLPPIQWHITTSNKGGVGKTLLSMMLLTHYSSDRPKDKAASKKLPLVVDLNGVNMDLRRLLGNRNLGTDSNGQIKRVDLGKGDTSLSIVKVNQPNHPFFLGWPSVDPFKMLDTTSFFNLLTVIKGEAIDTIKDQFSDSKSKVEVPVVIIDTNYHFCNIFSDNNMDYEYLKEFLWERDEFFIWFIWVYGQIRNLVQGDLPFAPLEKQRMELVSEQVETFLTSVTNQKKNSPFIHVLNPIGLKNDQDTNVGIMERLKNNLKFLMGGEGGKVKGGDDVVQEGDVDGKPIGKLDDLLKLPSGERKTFVDIQENMITAAEPDVQPQGEKGKEELVFAEHERTQKVLSKLEGILKRSGGRPKNLVPIPIYHEQIESYQDADHISLGAIRRLKVYTTFRDLLHKVTAK